MDIPGSLQGGRGGAAALTRLSHPRRRGRGRNGRVRVSLRFYLPGCWARCGSAEELLYSRQHASVRVHTGLIYSQQVDMRANDSLGERGAHTPRAKTTREKEGGSKAGCERLRSEAPAATVHVRNAGAHENRTSVSLSTSKDSDISTPISGGNLYIYSSPALQQRHSHGRAI